MLTFLCFLIFAKVTKSLILERQLYNMILKNQFVLTNYLFSPLKGITCMGYFVTNKETSFIFMMNMAPIMTLVLMS